MFDYLDATSFCDISICLALQEHSFLASFVGAEKSCQVLHVFDARAVCHSTSPFTYMLDLL
jgi:hypothetical protein